MDLTSMIRDLETQQELIGETLMSLRRLAVGNGQKRRGRPPKWLKQPPTVNQLASATDRVLSFVKSAKRKPMSKATRRKMAEAQKLRRKQERTA